MGTVTICMAKLKYSTAAGFHIQALPFTPSPKARPQQKSKQSDSIIPQATSWTAQSYSSFVVFLHLTLWHRKLLPSLPPCPLSPPGYSFNFLEENKKGSQHSLCLQERQVVDAPTVQAVSPLWQLAHRHCKTQITELQLTVLLHCQRSSRASRLSGQIVPLLCNTQGHMREYFPSEALSLVRALSTCEPHCGSNDVHPQACAPFHTRPWPPLMAKMSLWMCGPGTRCCVR